MSCIVFLFNFNLTQLPDALRFGVLRAERKKYYKSWQAFETNWPFEWRVCTQTHRANDFWRAFSTRLIFGRIIFVGSLLKIASPDRMKNTRNVIDTFAHLVERLWHFELTPTTTHQRKMWRRTRLLQFQTTKWRRRQSVLLAVVLRWCRRSSSVVSSLLCYQICGQVSNHRRKRGSDPFN